MDDCKGTYAQAIGKLVSEVSTHEYEAIKSLVTRFDDIMSEYGISARGAIDDFANGNVTQATQALERLVASAVQQDAKQTAREALAAFRQAAAKVQVQERIRDVVSKDKSTASDAVKSVRALGEMVATGYKNRLSLENTQAATTAKYLRQRFLGRIEKELGEKWTTLLSNEQTKTDVIREYFNLTRTIPATTKNEVAQKMARIIFDTRSEQRTNLANLGANSLRKDSIPISFDWRRIQGIGKDKFVSDFANALSSDTHGDLARRTAVATEAYESLERNKGLVDWHELGDKSSLNGVAGEYEARPVIDFANADSWINFNTQYGKKDILEAVRSDIEHSAKQEAAVRMFGPNPDRMFADLLSEAQLTERGTRDLSASHVASRVAGHYQRLTKISVPEHVRWAQLNSFGRAMRTASDLGGAVIAGFVDLPVQIFAAKAFYNVPVMQAIRDSLSGAFSHADREKATLLGSFAEGINNHISNRFGGNADSNPWNKGASNLSNWILRLSGLELWTEGWKSGATNVLASHLGRFVQSGTKFEDLPKQLRASLERFEISKGEWEALNRQHLDSNGRLDLFTIGNDASTTFGTQDKMTTWLIDQVESMVLSPGSRDRHYANLSFDPHSIIGTMVASMTQFMSFPVAFTRKLVARTLLGNEDTKTQAAANMAALILVTSITGGIVIQSKELLQGKKPYNWTDGDFILKAVVAGGGFGVFSDNFLKFGGEDMMRDVLGGDERSISDMRSLTGPLYSSILKLMEGTVSGVAHTAWGEGDKAAKDFRGVMHTLLQSVPGRSIWWLAALYRAAVLDNVAYAVDPMGHKQAQVRTLIETQSKAEGLFDPTRPSRDQNWVGEMLNSLRP